MARAIGMKRKKRTGAVARRFVAAITVATSAAASTTRLHRYISERRTASCWQAAASSAARAASGVGSSACMGCPPSNEIGADPQRDRPDGQADAEVIAGLAGRPEPGDDAGRRDGRVPD